MTLKSGFRIDQSHWKLQQWIPHVLLYQKPYLVPFMRYSLRYLHQRSILLPLLHLTPPTEGFPWDDLRKILHEGQRMAKVHNGEEILPRGSTPRVRRTDVTDIRLTDGFAIANTRVKESCSGKNLLFVRRGTILIADQSSYSVPVEKQSIAISLSVCVCLSMSIFL